MIRILRLQIYSRIPISLDIMVLIYKMDLDLEGQNHGDPKDKFNYKSVEAVIISSELFEKIHILGYKSNMTKLIQ
jgi:hypothetical protein